MGSLPRYIVFYVEGRLKDMDGKAILPIMFAALMALLGWNIQTTNQLQLAVQKLEIILLSDAFEK